MLDDHVATINSYPVSIPERGFGVSVMLIITSAERLSCFNP